LVWLGNFPLKTIDSIFNSILLKIKKNDIFGKESLHQSGGKGGGGPMTLLGILLVVVTCLVAIGIGYVANENVRNFDESTHVDFLGQKDEGGGKDGAEGLRQGKTIG
jgi:hypothetical protein